MTNNERDELLLQIVKNLGNVQESINILNIKLDNKINELNKKIDDTREELTQKIENVRTELTKKIEDTEEKLNNKMDENIKEAAQMFRDTWKDEYLRKQEIDNKIIDINRRLKM